MARNFVAASSDALKVAAAPVNVAPFSVSCWFKPVAATVQYTLVEIAVAGGADRWILQTDTAAHVQWQARVASSSAGATTSTTFSAGTFANAAAVERSSISRDCYLNGGGKSSNTSAKAPASVVNTWLGLASTAFPFNGVLAEVGIWNIALSDTEIAALGSTTAPISPLMMHPESLVFYAPLLRGTSPEIELMKGNNLTLTGTTSVAHPRIIYPSRHQKFRFGKTVAAVAPPYFPYQTGSDSLYQGSMIEY